MGKESNVFKKIFRAVLVNSTKTNNSTVTKINYLHTDVSSNLSLKTSYL